MSHPRFSVLLPTRNGGEFLDACIESVLNGRFDNIELIVSDNANVDSTPSVLAEWRKDNRLKVIHQKKTLSVTDNWNAALEVATGDYILMLGDDDFLLPEYFSIMDDLIREYDEPDCIIYNGVSYVAPNSISKDPNSYYSSNHFKYGPKFQNVFMLDYETRISLVKDMFRFKVGIPLNMQTTLVNRMALAKVPGGIFQAPFPDHYALNALLLTCNKWLFSPGKYVVVGVSPKSFGHYVYGNQQQSGLSYLKIESNFAGRLPGNELLNGMHSWLISLKKSFPIILQDVEIDRAGYLRRQVYAWIMQLNMGVIGFKEFHERIRMLQLKDILLLIQSAFDFESWRRLFKLISAKKQTNIEKQWIGLKPLNGVENIKQFAITYANGSLD